METSSQTLMPKATKGGSGLHTTMFCYFHIDLQDGDTFIKENDLKFSPSDTVLHEYTHFKWHGYDSKSDSYVLHLEFSSGNHALTVFSRRPIKMFRTRFITLNMFLTEEESQDRISFAMINMYYANVSSDVKFTTTMIYQGLDLVECFIPGGTTAPKILIYGSIESADLMDVINRSYQAEKIADCIEVQRIINALIFAFRLDLGHREADSVVKYYPFTTCFVDLQYIMTNYHLEDNFNIAELASTFGKYCKHVSYVENQEHKEYVLYSPEPHYLIAMLRSRVSWD